MASELAAQLASVVARASSAVSGSVKVSSGGRQGSAQDGQALPPGGSGQGGTQEDISQTVRQLNDYAQRVNRQLHFSVDDTSGRTVIKVVDPQTDQVIRQIPSEQILALAQFLQEEAKGTLFQQKA